MIAMMRRSGAQSPGRGTARLPFVERTLAAPGRPPAIYPGHCYSVSVINGEPMLSGCRFEDFVRVQ